MNLSTDIGKLHLNNFLYNASGVSCTTYMQYSEILNSNSGAFITKSCTLKPRNGNQYPKYSFKPGYSINSNGFENAGVQYYIDLKTSEKPFFFSVGGMSTEERLEILQHICDSDLDQYGIEINLSCPNLCQIPIASDPKELSKELDSLIDVITKLEGKQNVVGLKLPPYFYANEFREIAEIISDYSISFITCINGIPGCTDYDIFNGIPSIAPNDGFGGMGGPAVLPVGLANVSKFSAEFERLGSSTQIIGCGGVSTGEDAYKYILAGADAVQIGTALWNEGPQIFYRVSDEFSRICQKFGFENLPEIKNRNFRFS